MGEAVTDVADLADALEALLWFSPPRSYGHQAIPTMTGFLQHLGNPQDHYRWVHVAGTSGKTSTAYHVRDLLEASGKRVGLTVSPHVVAVNERVQIDGGPLPEHRFLAHLNEFLSLARSYGAELTYFELGVALALWTFAREQVDYAVVEVGIGGTRDATNVLQRADKVCVIGAIGLDHTELLGHTVREIAAQKAGIIGPHNAAVVLDQDPQVVDVVRDRVAEVDGSAEVVESSTLATFQERNAAVARATAQLIAVRDGFELVEPESLLLPPGRFEVFRTDDHRIVIDGAHNPQKMTGLVASLTAVGIDRVAALCTLMRAPEHKLEDTLAVLAPVVSHLVVTDYELGSGKKSKRSFPHEEVVAAARRLGMSVETADGIDDGVRRLLARPEPDLLVTGSLYLVSLVRPLLAT